MGRRLMMMLVALATWAMVPGAQAQGWPARYSGVMLQGFAWDSFHDTAWKRLEAQADDLAPYFSLIWVPQSGYTGKSVSMGYDPLYWFRQDSSFGTEAELRSMIAAYKQRGTGIIADVVINHRANVSTWTDFPSEEYRGVTYQMTSQDIVSNDEAASAGYPVGPNADTGDGWSGMRDLDHLSSNVQTSIKAYLKFLLEDLQYAGFRYDLVKGYAPYYTRLYNEYAAPTYSVGEYWDGNYDKVKSWIDGTQNASAQPTSAAFDFPNKYALNEACNNGNWNSLVWKRYGTIAQPAGLIHMDQLQRYAVTFVDNHDTYRDHNAISHNIPAANAFILSMPGTPTVFLPHFHIYGSAIKAMISARAAAGVHNQSEVQVLSTSSDLFAAVVTGSNGRLFVKVGPGTYATPSGYTAVASGDNYLIALHEETRAVWFSVEGGELEAGSTVNLSAINAGTSARIYYTTDGTTPTETTGQLYSGPITINADTKLQAILVDASGTSRVYSRQYRLAAPFTPTQATVYIEKSNDWGNLHLYAWDSSGNQLLGAWPGRALSQTVDVGGRTWYTHTFDITKSGYTVNIVLNNGLNTKQTVDVTRIDKDAYYTIDTQTNATGKYLVVDATETMPAELITPDSGLRLAVGKGYIDIYSETPNRVTLRTILGETLRTIDVRPETIRIDGLLSGVYLLEGHKIIVP